MPKKRGGSEIQLARGRLKGVLQDLVGPSDSEDEEDHSHSKSISTPRNRQTKRSKLEVQDQIGLVHESFIMKLFDRSLDLAKFKENTALYPICRSWMANEPRNTDTEIDRDQKTPPPQLREANYDVYNKIISGEVKHVRSMPLPKPSQMSRIPDMEITKSSIDELLDHKSTIPRDELLNMHKVKWLQTRKTWLSHTREYQERYDLNFEILNTVKDN